MTVVQSILKRHDSFYEVINSSTIHLNRFPLNMCSVLDFTDDGVSFTCPIAYYVTDEQRDLLLDSCKKNKTKLWYSGFGWGPNIGECDDSCNAKYASLPDDILFEDRQDALMVVAHSLFARDIILSTPEEFYNSLKLIDDYALALRNQELPSIIYSRMVKTITDPLDPRSLFYSYLLLYRRSSEAHNWLMVDFEDVKTSLEHSKELVFYPSLESGSFDGLLQEMESAFRPDVSLDEPYGIIVTLTLPNDFVEIEKVYALRQQFAADYVRFIIYTAENEHPFSAEMVLLKNKEMNNSTPGYMTLVEADTLFSNSVAYKIVDIHTEDYPVLLADNREAVVFKINTDGTSSDIADRMVAAIDSLDGDNKEVLYALEVQNKWALIPDHSIISQEMQTRYNVKKEIVGTDGKDYKDAWEERLVYTNVLVGVIIRSSNNTDS